ncbi:MULTISPECIES: hypothetical protein [unclassified Pseudofrankia]|uniref:hypothetical protein n=1 Tax=unclassified Pseudofrankia TaxID=2994372 RepID=UPI0008DB12A9|nr:MULTISPECIES: hypothetical protein [unclassified Pseudofrankia]MDT3441807.1 hypothetical protein [Pseudofrankia sp. BMG5.37]OHV47094.1 hypothetical protein BCD48_20360 [Pseudofrankia sp. BMG5.36]
MRLKPVVSVCSSGSCPTVYAADDDTDDDTLIVQGYIPPQHLAMDVPVGEGRVVIPRELLGEAARRLLAASEPPVAQQ